MKGLSQTVIEELSWYVYLYIDPCEKKERVFYVGKGTGNRALSHLSDTQDRKMVRRIKTIRSKGHEPRIDILASGLEEEGAFIVEAAAIDLIGIESLVNENRGQDSIVYGRIPLDEFVLLYDAEEAEIIDPVLLIRINQLYEYDMTPEELYKVTRGVWRIDVNRAEKVKYVLAIFGGIVREVYAVDFWVRAETIKNYWTPLQQEEARGRWAFNGKVAEKSVRERYKDKSVENNFSKGAQNPIKYVNA